MSENEVYECPKCHQVFTNKSKTCKARGAQGTFKTHYRMCKRLPLPEQLAREFDANPLLTVKDVVDRYQTAAPTVFKRLEGTRWHRDRLNLRGRLVRRYLLRSKKGAIKTTPCLRCQIITGNTGRLGLCPMCQNDLSRIWKNLKAGCLRYRLNDWDLNWLVGGLA